MLSREQMPLGNTMPAERDSPLIFPIKASLLSGEIAGGSEEQPLRQCLALQPLQLPFVAWPYRSGQARLQEPSGGSCWGGPGGVLVLLAPDPHLHLDPSLLAHSCCQHLLQQLGSRVQGRPPPALRSHQQGYGLEVEMRRRREILAGVEQGRGQVFERCHQLRCWCRGQP